MLLIHQTYRNTIPVMSLCTWILTGPLPCLPTRKVTQNSQDNISILPLCLFPVPVHPKTQTRFLQKEDRCLGSLQAVCVQIGIGMRAVACRKRLPMGRCSDLTRNDPYDEVVKELAGKKTCARHNAANGWSSASRGSDSTVLPLRLSDVPQDLER